MHNAPMSMMMMAGPNVPGVGLGLYAFLWIVSGVFYLLCAWFLWVRLRNEKNDLISALMAFLLYQTISMVFFGLIMQTMHIVYGLIAGLAVLIGSAYMLKFPFYSFSQATRKVIFILSLIVAIGIFGYFVANPALQISFLTFILWYDLVINGLVVGGFMIFLAIKTTERWLKFKAFGGGSGVISCCVVANATAIGGSMLVGSFFQFLAPVLILATLLYARKKQNSTVSQPTRATV